MRILKYHCSSLGKSVAPSRCHSNSSSYATIQLNGLVFNLQDLAFNDATPLTVCNPSNHRLTVYARCKSPDSLASLIPPDHAHDDSFSNKNDQKPQQVQEEAQDKNFCGAVALIIGTAVGPGMLGLPAATIRSGPVPSTIAILLSWVYVISSIILVAELSFAAMEEDNVPEVSFTGLARKGLGSHMAAFIALVYASLSLSLLVACVSGIGSIVSQWFPWINPVVAHALVPSLVGIILWFFPFKVIDAANRFLCVVMLLSISALVVIGVSVGRKNILGAFAHASWEFSSVLPAIPVTVLTLGFHVITPFICRIAGNSVNDARRAILFGGLVPLAMVVVWNLIVLGFSSANTALSSGDAISMLLSVNPSALLAVQSFAFSALATSLIGYAVSFPKQVFDTFELIFGKSNSMPQYPSQTHSAEDEVGKVGFATYSSGQDVGSMGKVSYGGSVITTASEAKLASGFGSIMMPSVLGISVLIASLFRSTFSMALDFAGIYANCFLFGILPPLMTYVYQSRKKIRSSILPGGKGALLLLFSIAVTLGIWH